MMRQFFLAFFLAFFAIPAAAQASPFGTLAPVQDSELAQARGGFILPNGWDIALAVYQTTSIDGQVVLQTAYVLDQGAPQISLHVPDGSPAATVLDQGSRQLVSVELSGTAVSHLMGRTVGSAIANTANNRVIDTATIVDIDLSRLPVGSVGSLAPRLDNLASLALTLALE